MVKSEFEKTRHLNSKVPPLLHKTSVKKSWNCEKFFTSPGKCLRIGQLVKTGGFVSTIRRRIITIMANKHKTMHKKSIKAIIKVFFPFQVWFKLNTTYENSDTYIIFNWLDSIMFHDIHCFITKTFHANMHSQLRR